MSVIEDPLPAKTQIPPKDRWGECPGCGRERRLAWNGEVMREHNRWVPVAWERIECEGSGVAPENGGELEQGEAGEAA